MRPPQYWLADRHSECGAGGERTEHADDQASPKYESSPHFGFNDGGLIQKLHARTSGISDLSTRKPARRPIANPAPHRKSVTFHERVGAVAPVFELGECALSIRGGRPAPD